MIRNFNDRFFNPEFYSTHPRDPLNSTFAPNTKIVSGYFEDVVNFCMAYNVHELLGLSPIDIMNYFDLGTYTRLKEQVEKYHQKKMEVMEQTKSELTERQNDLFKGTKNHVRK